MTDDTVTPEGDAPLSGQPAVPSAGELAGAVTDQLRHYLARRRGDAAYIGADYDELIATLRTSCFAAVSACGRHSPTGLFARSPQQPTARSTSPRSCCSRRWNCCTLAHWFTTTSSTIPRPARHADRTRPVRLAASRPTLERLGGSVRQIVSDPARDLALVWADDIVADAPLEPGALRRVRQVWADIRTEVLAGQYLDIVAESSRADSIASAMNVNRFKTASYTVTRPLQLWAAAAADRPDVQAAFHEVGNDLGVAFQLRDDVLGVFGNPQSPASRPVTIFELGNAPCCWPRPFNEPMPATRPRPDCCARRSAPT